MYQDFFVLCPYKPYLDFRGLSSCTKSPKPSVWRTWWRGLQSEKQPLPSGVGQGTILGLFLFCILFNEAGPTQNYNTAEIITSKKDTIGVTKKKWVDDLTVAVPLNLKHVLRNDPNPKPFGPINLHKQTGHILPLSENTMQTHLGNLEDNCELNKMTINSKKTLLMLFNRSRKFDFEPELKLQGKEINVIEKTKLVGYMFTSDLKTKENTNHLLKKAYSNMWTVRQLKLLGAEDSTLILVLKAQVISMLTFAAP